jgi:hypothetical protein
MYFLMNQLLALDGRVKNCIASTDTFRGLDFVYKDKELYLTDLNPYLYDNASFAFRVRHADGT